MNKDGISIIIPAKNEEHYLQRTLEAIDLQKDIPNLEVIVSIAPSTEDNTALIAKNHKCKIVEGGRLATARNKGADKSSYNLLFFLDADTFPKKEDFLSKAIKEFNDRNLDVAGVFLSPDYNGNRIKNAIYKTIFAIENYCFLRREKTKKPKMGGGMFVRKTAFSKLNGFKEGIFGEDSEFAERAVRNKQPHLNFGILKTCGDLATSVRRYERDGILRTLWKVMRLNTKAEIFGYDSVRGAYDHFYKLC